MFLFLADALHELHVDQRKRIVDEYKGQVKAWWICNCAGGDVSHLSSLFLVTAILPLAFIY